MKTSHRLSAALLGLWGVINTSNANAVENPGISDSGLGAPTTTQPANSSTKPAEYRSPAPKNKHKKDYGEASDTLVDEWKLNNPEGFMAAINQETDYYILNANAQEVTIDGSLLSAEQVNTIKINLPENPGDIRRQAFGIYSQLGENGQAIQGNLAKIQENIALAAQMKTSAKHMSGDEHGQAIYSAVLLEREAEGLMQQLGVSRAELVNAGLLDTPSPDQAKAQEESASPQPTKAPDPTGGLER